MRGRIRRAAVAVGAACALSALGVTGVGAAGASAQSARAHSAGVSTAAAVPGTQLWVKRYNGPASGMDGAAAVVDSPDGRRVFVTGSSDGRPATGLDYATVAYRAATGARLWAARYNSLSSGVGVDEARSVAVSPDGSKVFVTGTVSDLYLLKQYWATVAYNASTGARLWARVYHGPVHAGDVARSLAVSPDGSKVFVTGDSNGAASGADYATVAYNASTGARLWASRYSGPANDTDDTDNPFAVAVNPAGTKVFVTGRSQGGSRFGFDYATVAYRASTGARLWASRYNGPGHGDDVAISLVVGSAGSKVFVTGHSKGVSSGEDYATVAYSTATGAQAWVKRYNGPGNGGDSASSVAVSPAGTKVYITGRSFGGAATGDDYATVAYNAVTGKFVWLHRYNGNGNGNDGAASLTVSPAGTKVAVTGSSYGGPTTANDYATVTYNG